MTHIPLQDWRRPVTPRSLALWSLSIAAPDPLPSARLVLEAEILDIGPPAMRVALGRLLREGMATQVSRGSYALGSAAAAIHAKARGWTDTEAAVKQWRGRWIIAIVDHLGRSDRRRVQARDRALRLTGLAPSASGAWVRPDNLARDAERLVTDLRGLGLDSDAVVLADCDAGARDDDAFRRLWPIAQLESGYRRWLRELTESAARVRSLSFRDAARETFLLGQSVIRAINSDPLLPAEMVDVGLRASVVEAMKDYDAMARHLWARIGSVAPPSATRDAHETGRAAA